MTTDTYGHLFPRGDDGAELKEAPADVTVTGRRAARGVYPTPAARGGAVIIPAPPLLSFVGSNRRIDYPNVIRA